jgi:hypothetical protein
MITTRPDLRYILVIATAMLLYVIDIKGRVYADHVNVTGQGQQTPGSEPSYPGNPGEGTKPSLPGDQPAKQGTDPSSQVHNVKPHDLKKKHHEEPQKTP